MPRPDPIAPFAAPDPILENARLAVACGAEAPLVLAVALASAPALDVPAAMELLARYAPEIDALVRRGAGPAGPAPLEDALRFDPELGLMRPDLDDHEIRGRLLFGELLGHKSFFQVAAWSVGGVEISAADAELLAHVGVLTQLLDARIWPLAIARRIAANGGGLARALVGGAASLATPKLAGLPVAGFMRFLDRVDAEVAAGAALDDVLGAALARREIVPGLGRPVLGRDERVPQQMDLYARYDRAGGASVLSALAIDRFFGEQKGVRLNSAGLFGALMRDLGFKPGAAAAFSTIYFVVPVLAQAAFSARDGSA